MTGRGLKAILGLVLIGAMAQGSAEADTLCVRWGGGSGCYSTIQAAIDAAQEGDTIDVYPGSYGETAAGRTVLAGTPDANGPHQFGLFIDQTKNGLTIRGVDWRGRAIRSLRKVQAYVTTHATNDFGPSGIFVEGDDVTISGLSIGINPEGQNKTIEVIGDAFTLVSCDVTDTWGSIYLNDWRFDAQAGVSHVQSYFILGNSFADGVSIDIASGAGYSGPVSSRHIEGNSFSNADYWPSISFNGTVPGVAWFAHPVGGAVIAGNAFVNTFGTDYAGWEDDFLYTAGHIRARGTYDNSQFDWQAYLRQNAFDEAYATGPHPPRELRAYSYTRSSVTFDNVRRIGSFREGEDAIAQPGDETVSAR